MNPSRPCFEECLKQGSCQMSKFNNDRCRLRENPEFARFCRSSWRVWIGVSCGVPSLVGDGPRSGACPRWPQFVLFARLHTMPEKEGDIEALEQEAKKITTRLRPLRMDGARFSSPHFGAEDQRAPLSTARRCRLCAGFAVFFPNSN